MRRARDGFWDQITLSRPLPLFPKIVGVPFSFLNRLKKVQEKVKDPTYVGSVSPDELPNLQ